MMTPNDAFTLLYNSDANDDFHGWNTEKCLEVIKQIQLDAIHSALSEAADLCAMTYYGSECRPNENLSHVWKYTSELDKAILAFRDKKES